MAPEATRERASETTSAQGLERKVPLFLVFFLFLVVVVVFFFRGFEFFCFLKMSFLNCERGKRY